MGAGGVARGGAKSSAREQAAVAAEAPPPVFSSLFSLPPLLPPLAALPSPAPKRLPSRACFPFNGVETLDASHRAKTASSSSSRAASSAASASSSPHALSSILLVSSSASLSALRAAFSASLSAQSSPAAAPLVYVHPVSGTVHPFSAESAPPSSPSHLVLGLPCSSAYAAALPAAQGDDAEAAFTRPGGGKEADAFYAAVCALVVQQLKNSRSIHTVVIRGDGTWMERLKDVLRGHPSVSAISLEAVTNLSEKELTEGYARLLSSLSRCAAISVRGCGLKAKGLKALLQGLSKHGNLDLQEIDLSHNELDDEAASHLVSFLPSCAPTRLRTLRVGHNPWSLSALDSFLSSFAPCASPPAAAANSAWGAEEGLALLSLSGLGDAALSVGSALFSHLPPSLRLLSLTAASFVSSRLLRRTLLSAAAPSHAHATLHALTHLDLSGLPSLLTDADVVLLAETLFPLEPTKLAGSAPGAEGGRARGDDRGKTWTSASKRAAAHAASASGKGKGAPQAALALASPSLVSLSLAGNNLSGACLPALTAGLLAPSCRLEHLDLSANIFGKREKRHGAGGDAAGSAPGAEKKKEEEKEKKRTHRGRGAGGRARAEESRGGGAGAEANAGGDDPTEGLPIEPLVDALQRSYEEPSRAPCGLRYLSLARCCLSLEALQQLAAALLTNEGKLLFLDLRGNLGAREEEGEADGMGPGGGRRGSAKKKRAAKEKKAEDEEMQLAKCAFEAVVEASGLQLLLLEDTPEVRDAQPNEETKLAVGEDEEGERRRDKKDTAEDAEKKTKKGSKEPSGDTRKRTGRRKAAKEDGEEKDSREEEEKGEEEKEAEQEKTEEEEKKDEQEDEEEEADSPCKSRAGRSGRGEARKPLRSKAGSTLRKETKAAEEEKTPKKGGAVRTQERGGRGRSAAAPARRPPKEEEEESEEDDDEDDESFDELDAMEAERRADEESSDGDEDEEEEQDSDDEDFEEEDEKEDEEDEQEDKDEDGEEDDGAEESEDKEEEEEKETEETRRATSRRKRGALAGSRVAEKEKEEKESRRNAKGRKGEQDEKETPRKAPRQRRGSGATAAASVARRRADSKAEEAKERSEDEDTEAEESEEQEEAEAEESEQQELEAEETREQEAAQSEEEGEAEESDEEEVEEEEEAEESDGDFEDEEDEEYKDADDDEEYEEEVTPPRGAGRKRRGAPQKRESLAFNTGTRKRRKTAKEEEKAEEKENEEADNSPRDGRGRAKAAAGGPASSKASKESKTKAELDEEELRSPLLRAEERAEPRDEAGVPEDAAAGLSPRLQSSSAPAAHPRGRPARARRHREEKDVQEERAAAEADAQPEETGEQDAQGEKDKGQREEFPLAPEADGHPASAAAPLARPYSYFVAESGRIGSRGARPRRSCSVAAFPSRAAPGALEGACAGAASGAVPEARKERREGGARRRRSASFLSSSSPSISVSSPLEPAPAPPPVAAVGLCAGGPGAHLRPRRRDSRHGPTENKAKPGGGAFALAGGARASSVGPAAAAAVDSPFLMYFDMKREYPPASFPPEGPRGGDDARARRRNSALPHDAADADADRGEEKAVGADGEPGALASSAELTPWRVENRRRSLADRPVSSGGSGASLLPPVPVSAEEQRDIRLCLQRAGTHLLSLFFPRDSHSYVGKTPLQPLLRSYPQDILVALKYILSSHYLPLLSFPDIYTLQQLHLSPHLSPSLRLLLSVIFEELPRINMTYKYQQYGILGFDENLCHPGKILFDGGPGCQAIHAAEFRVFWMRRHGRRLTRRRGLPEPDGLRALCARGSGGSRAQLATAPTAVGGGVGGAFGRRSTAGPDLAHLASPFLSPQPPLPLSSPAPSCAARNGGREEREREGEGRFRGEGADFLFASSSRSSESLEDPVCHFVPSPSCLSPKARELFAATPQFVETPDRDRGLSGMIETSPRSSFSIPGSRESFACAPATVFDLLEPSSCAGALASGFSADGSFEDLPGATLSGSFRGGAADTWSGAYAAGPGPCGASPFFDPQRAARLHGDSVQPLPQCTCCGLWRAGAEDGEAKTAARGVGGERVGASEKRRAQSSDDVAIAGASKPPQPRPPPSSPSNQGALPAESAAAASAPGAAQGSSRVEKAPAADLFATPAPFRWMKKALGAMRGRPRVAQKKAKVVRNLDFYFGQKDQSSAEEKKQRDEEEPNVSAGSAAAPVADPGREKKAAAGRTEGKRAGEIQVEELGAPDIPSSAVKSKKPEGGAVFNGGLEDADAAVSVSSSSLVSSPSGRRRDSFSSHDETAQLLQPLGLPTVGLGAGDEPDSAVSSPAFSVAESNEEVFSENERRPLTLPTAASTHAAAGVHARRHDAGAGRGSRERGDGHSGDEKQEGDDLGGALRRRSLVAGVDGGRGGSAFFPGTRLPGPYCAAYGGAYSSSLPQDRFVVSWDDDDWLRSIECFLDDLSFCPSARLYAPAAEALAVAPPERAPCAAAPPPPLSALGASAAKHAPTCLLSSLPAASASLAACSAPPPRVLSPPLLPPFAATPSVFLSSLSAPLVPAQPAPPPAARPQPHAGSEFCTCREVIVVDVQSDAQLRKRIWDVQTLFASSSAGLSTHRKIELLRRMVLRNIKFASTGYGEQKDEVKRLATEHDGFVYLGDIKYGFPRHMALLFKVLCDAAQIPCRVMRPSLHHFACEESDAEIPRARRERGARGGKPSRDDARAPASAAGAGPGVSEVKQERADKDLAGDLNEATQAQKQNGGADDDTPLSRLRHASSAGDSDAALAWSREPEKKPETRGGAKSLGAAGALKRREEEAADEFVYNVVLAKDTNSSELEQLIPVVWTTTPSLSLWRRYMNLQGVGAGLKAGGSELRRASSSAFFSFISEEREQRKRRNASSLHPDFLSTGFLRLNPPTFASVPIPRRLRALQRRLAAAAPFCVRPSAAGGGRQGFNYFSHGWVDRRHPEEAAAHCCCCAARSVPLPPALEAEGERLKTCGARDSQRAAPGGAKTVPRPQAVEAPDNATHAEAEGRMVRRGEGEPESGAWWCTLSVTETPQQHRQHAELDRLLLAASGASACLASPSPSSSAPAAATELDLDAYFEFREKLGKGSFGEVWRVRLKHPFAGLARGERAGDAEGGDEAGRRRRREKKKSKRETGMEPPAEDNAPLNSAAADADLELLAGRDAEREREANEERKPGGEEQPSEAETEEKGNGKHERDPASPHALRGKELGPPEYALKLVPKSEENLPEAEIMRNYSHPRVVPFLGVFEGFQMLEDRSKKKVKTSSLCFLMDIADQSLESLLEEHERANTCIDEEFILTILLDTARGMNYLHSPSATKPHLLHRDLKPANILLKDGRAMVTDFGVARVAEVSFEHEMTQGPGTEGYIAPEQRTAAYDRPADVWAFGVVCARLLGLREWRKLSEPHHRVALADFALKDAFLINLCLACLERRPLMRPSFQQIVNRLIGKIFRVEFERILRTPYRYCLPLLHLDHPCVSSLPSPAPLSARRALEVPAVRAPLALLERAGVAESRNLACAAETAPPAARAPQPRGAEPCKAALEDKSAPSSPFLSPSAGAELSPAEEALPRLPMSAPVPPPPFAVAGEGGMTELKRRRAEEAPVSQQPAKKKRGDDSRDARRSPQIRTDDDASYFSGRDEVDESAASAATRGAGGAAKDGVQAKRDGTLGVDVLPAESAPANDGDEEDADFLARLNLGNAKKSRRALLLCSSGDSSPVERRDVVEAFAVGERNTESAEGGTRREASWEQSSSGECGEGAAGSRLTPNGEAVAGTPPRRDADGSHSAETSQSLGKKSPRSGPESLEAGAAGAATQGKKSAQSPASKKKLKRVATLSPSFAKTPRKPVASSSFSSSSSSSSSSSASPSSSSCSSPSSRSRSRSPVSSSARSRRGAGDAGGKLLGEKADKGERGRADRSREEGAPKSGKGERRSEEAKRKASRSPSRERGNGRARSRSAGRSMSCGRSQGREREEKTGEGGDMSEEKGRHRSAPSDPRKSPPSNPRDSAQPSQVASSPLSRFEKAGVHGAEGFLRQAFPRSGRTPLRPSPHASSSSSSSSSSSPSAPSAPASSAPVDPRLGRASAQKRDANHVAPAKPASVSPSAGPSSPAQLLPARSPVGPAAAPASAQPPPQACAVSGGFASAHPRASPHAPVPPASGAAGGAFGGFVPARGEFAEPVQPPFFDPFAVQRREGERRFPAGASLPHGYPTGFQPAPYAPPYAVPGAFHPPPGASFPPPYAFPAPAAPPTAWGSETRALDDRRGDNRHFGFQPGGAPHRPHAPVPSFYQPYPRQ
ncbi:hypothetical protein BESB_015810 [Besnoitia besnoiti]|uniref:Protein kinase domain-containing protein n=1 Tax=Besnoitia besnoiti TaxID=94643 RepID=A0A2A9M9A5_BESBE|nr:hypothetical protein BESB_015810 [Besnoitia besnoiti]PFH32263.1 hypothetical protein BESB_015810 [Besnoitia besnoiti]